MRRAISTGVLALAAACAQTGPQVASFHSPVDGSEQPYALYIPKSFDPARTYPLVVSLHAEESTHRLNLRQVFGIVNRFGDLAANDLRFFPVARDVQFIVACPLARGTMGYRGIAEQDVYDMLADVRRRFPIDPARVYLTGFSMGGGGALRLALTRPDVWAAVAVVSPVAVTDAEELAPNALNLPVRLFQGEADPLVPAASSRTWHRRLEAADAPVEYIEYPAVRHNAWEPAYHDAGIFEWFAGFRRNAYPERVRLVTRSYRYAAAYWVRIDGLTPGLAASIDARRTGARVEVETHGVDGFSLLLDRPATAVSIDGAPVRIRPAASLSFTRASGRWQPGLWKPSGKRPGAEGPIAEAVAGRHIYVYGTGGAPGAEELARRRAEAEAAAQWSTPRVRLALTLPVKADRDVSVEDVDSSALVLFGTAATNTLIARFAPLPLALHPDAADYGLLFVAPGPRHPLLISSGLPWWTGAEEADRPGDAFAPPRLRLLESFGDYILFKGSLTHVVSEGRFDRNWKVTPADAAAMAATGTVTIQP